jgi:hypothetical protein
MVQDCYALKPVYRLDYCPVARARAGNITSVQVGPIHQQTLRAELPGFRYSPSQPNQNVPTHRTPYIKYDAALYPFAPPNRPTAFRHHKKYAEVWFSVYSENA